MPKVRVSGQGHRVEELQGLLRAAGWCTPSGPVDLQIRIDSLRSDETGAVAATATHETTANTAPGENDPDAASPRLLVLTSEASDEDAHARLLRSGADAVLPLDAGCALVLAVAEALTRHLRSAPSGESGGGPAPLTWGPISLDPTSRLATVCGSPVHLTQTEGKLLEVLLASQGTIVPKTELLASVWGAWYGRDHLVEVHLSRLRIKIMKAGGPPVPIAVAGLGYRLN